MNKQKTIEALRGIGIAVEGLMDELQESDAPKPFQAVSSRPFERGDRVKYRGEEFDILRIEGNRAYFRFDGNDFESNAHVGDEDLTLVTPASDREIQVGDTVVDISDRIQKEFIAKQIIQEYLDCVIDKSGIHHALRNCILRSRTQPKPNKFADDPAIQAAIGTKRADAIVLLSGIGKLIKKWEKS